MPDTSSPSRTALRIVATLAAVSVIVFTIWIIHEANIARDNILFRTVRATPYGDKIGHCLLAGLLTLVANFLFRHRCFKLSKAPLPRGSLLVALLVLLEEGSQAYLPTRSFDLYDALANFVGIAFASLPAIWLFYKKTT